MALRFPSSTPPITTPSASASSSASSAPPPAAPSTSDEPPATPGASPRPFIYRPHTSQSDIRIAPPSSTPRRFSLPSLSSAARVHSTLDPVLRHELEPSFYRVAVDDFLTKFLPLPASLPAPEDSAPAGYDRSLRRWASHPPDYSEAVYGSFLASLAQALVAPYANLNARRFCYYARSEPFRGGTGAKRRADFYVAHAQHSTGATPAWADVLIIGELTKPNKTEMQVLVQLGGYAREVFVAQPGRRFVPAFYLHRDQMTLYHFDRAGAVATDETFDINQEWHRFVHTMLAYATLPEPDLGMDSTVHRPATTPTPTTASSSSSSSLGYVMVGAEQFVVTRVIYVRPSLVGRCTVCWETRGPDSVAFVIKDSWRQQGQTPEKDMYERANQYHVPGIAILYVGIDVLLDPSGLPDDIFTIRKGPPSEGDVPGDGGRGKRKKQKRSSVKIMNRVHSRLVLREAIGVPLDVACTTMSASAFFRAIRDAMQCYTDLYDMARILHRDVSPDNILCSTSATQLTGGAIRSAWLIDFDYAITMDHPNSGASHITGKAAYLALSVSEGLPNSVRSDMESFFYVICTMCVEPGALEQWHGTDMDACVSIKRRHLQSRKKFQQHVLSRVRPAFQRVSGVESLLQDLRDSVTTVGTWAPEGDECDALLSAMETPGKPGHDARINFMKADNKLGVELGKAMMAHLDRFLDHAN